MDIGNTATASQPVATTEDMTIWHNPRCSKSRQTLALLRDRGIEPVIVEYLKAPPTEEEIARVIALLGVEPKDLMRAGEALFRDLDLAAVTEPATLIAAMAAHPILIERPVVIVGEKAGIGRPPEAVLSLL